MITVMTYEEALERYRALVEGRFGLKLKGKANPYTSMNGNMFSFLDKEGCLCLRMAKEDRLDFVAANGGEPVVQYGAVMKEYVAVPEGMLSDTAALEAVFATCLDYAKSLKAKPTKKR